MTTTLRTVRTLCRCVSLRSSLSSISRRHFAISTTSASTPVPTLFGQKESEAPIESPEKRQAIVYLTQQLETSTPPTPDHLPSLLTLAQQHHLSYFIHHITRLTLASQHTSLFQYADAGEWDKCETWLREKYADDANKLPHYDAYTLNMKNPYEMEKEPPPFKLLRSGMKLHKPVESKEEQPSIDSLTAIITRAKHRKAEEKAANEVARLERQAKNSFPVIQDAPTKYPITFFHVIELLDACGWEHLSRAAYQHAIDTGYIATPAIRMHNYMIYAVSLPRRVTSIAVRTWLYDIKQRYDVLKKMPKEDLQIILGKGWRGKYDNPIATLVRQDIIDMLQSQYGMASEISPSNPGILLIHRSELQKWILSHIPTNNLILPLPAQIHVKDQSIEQATAAVSSLMNEIIRQFEFGQSPQHGLHIVTGIGQSYINQHSSAPYVPILREPLLKLLHETYDLQDAHVDTRDESMIRISKNQMERWLRYRIWKRQIPSSLQSQVAHIKPNYGVPSQQTRLRTHGIVPAHIQQLNRK